MTYSMVHIGSNVKRIAQVETSRVHPRGSSLLSNPPAK